MSIAKIKKITIISIAEEKDEVLGVLQKAGVVHLACIPDEGGVSDSATKGNLLHKLYNVDIKPELSDIDADISQLEYTMGFISEFHKEKILRTRPIFNFEQLQERANNLNWKDIYTSCYQHDRTLKQISLDKNRMSTQIQALRPWEGLDIAVENIHSTKSCNIFLGILPLQEKTIVEEKIKNIGAPVATHIIREDKDNLYLLVAHRKQDEENISGILKSAGFQYVYLPDIKGTIKENIEKLHKNTKELELEHKTITEEVKKFLPHIFHLMCIYDFLYLRRQRREALAFTKASRKTIVIQGWIPKKNVPAMVDKMKQTSIYCEAFISDPGKDDNPPVVLDNRQPIKPFEYITSVYGTPQRFEIDPTPILAPFFFVFFGFCLTDAGYGIIVFLVSLWALLKFKPKGEFLYLLWILCLGGISTIFFGTLVGGWFGNAHIMIADAFPIFQPLSEILSNIGIFNPMADPADAINLMLFALGLGVIHIMCAHIAGLTNNLKNGLWKDALMDQCSMLALLMGIVGLILSSTGVLWQELKNIFLILLTVGTVGIIVFAGRTSKTIGFRIFNGFYAAYNAWSGFISDVLSYSRLWGLGLVAGAMATTVNILATQIGQMLWGLPIIGPILGIIIGALIIVVGHMFSIAINVLGALIHTSRLQFVEFFSKFFKGDGKPFIPFVIKTKYVALR